MSKVLPLIKPSINVINNNRLCRFKTNSLLGELIVSSGPNFETPSFNLTEIIDKNGNKLGFENYNIDRLNSVITGFCIEIEKNYRNCGAKLGEILRLASIINMMENKVERFEIISKPEAMYFHSKYKFTPAIKQFVLRDEILNWIITSKSDAVKSFLLEAHKIQESVANSGNDVFLKRELCVKTNELLDKIINIVVQDKKLQEENPFKTCVNLVLTKEKVLKNKDYFNELFNSHGIDYQI